MANDKRNRGQQQNQEQNIGRNQQPGNQRSSEMESSQTVSNSPNQQSQRSGLGSSSKESLGSERNIDRREEIRE